MTKICEECGVCFEGIKTTHYCPKCRLKIQKEAAKKYYQTHRAEIRAKQKKYQTLRAASKKTHDKPMYDTTGWKIEYLRVGDLWTWKATKGNVILEAHRNFYSLRTAQKDCLLALG